MLRTRTNGIALLVLASLPGCGPSAPDPIFGVRLGMSPAQVRERFAPGAPGTFRSEAMGEDFALVWRPLRETGSVRRARGEFHLGQLVALRLELAPDSPAARGPGMELTQVSVLTRERRASAIALNWLARSCPTHAHEVRRRIEEHE